MLNLFIDHCRSKQLLFTLILGLCMALSACNSKKEKVRGGSCKTDGDCIAGWICEENFCIQGKRNAAEIAAQKEAKRKAKEAKRKAKEAKKRQAKAGEGRLHARICPFFKNTDDAVATLVAVNRETKRRHLKSLHLEVNNGSVKDLFTFYSLPLGEYEVTAQYGVQVNGVFDTHELSCDPKSTDRDCEAKTKRIVKVELAKTTLEEDLKKKYPCDWIAE